MLCRVLGVACRICIVASGLLTRCGTWGLGHAGSVVVSHGFSCPVACGILVPQPGIKPTSPPLEGKFLTTGPPGKSQVLDFEKMVSGHLHLASCFCIVSVGVECLFSRQMMIREVKWVPHPYGRKRRRTKKPLGESERVEFKSWLKAQHSEN